MVKVKMVRDISGEEDCDFWSGGDRSPAKKKARKEELKTRQLEVSITPCTQCGKAFKGTAGVKIHTARKHSTVTGTPKLVTNEKCNDVRESMKKDCRNSPPSSSLPPPWSPLQPSPLQPETNLLLSGYGEYMEEEEEEEEEYEEKPVVNFDKVNCYRELVDLLRNKEYEEKTMIKELQEVMIKQKLEMNTLTVSQNLVERCENSSQQQEEEEEEMKKIQSQERKKELHKKFDNERQGIIKRCNARISDIHSEVKTIEETLLKVLHQTYLGEKRRRVKKEDPSGKENIDTIVQPQTPDEDSDAADSEIIDHTNPQSTTGEGRTKEEDNNIDIDAIQAQLQKDNFSDFSDDEDSDTEEEVSCKVEIIDTSDEDCEIETRVEDKADGNEEKRLNKEDFIPSLSLTLSHSTSLHKTMEQLWMKKCRVDICPITATDLLKAWKIEKDNSEDEEKIDKIIDSENEEDEDINELIDSITELWERHNNIC